METPGKLLPSPNSLFTFEAAARHLSFTRAAAELQVSQPAVSHSVRQLEQHLGVKLFERRHKGVQLTDAGRYLLEQVTVGLDHIYGAVRDLRALGKTEQRVTLSVSTATATYWLLPRVARFKQAHPRIELRCITTDTDRDLKTEGIDLAIPLGSGEWSQYHKWHFVDEEVFPVCSPAYLAKEGPLAEPGAFLDATLLHLEERYRPRLDWTTWLGRFGVRAPLPAKGFVFSDYSIVIQAALENQGVALGWRHIVKPLLEQGRLVRPLDASVKTDQPLFIIAPKTIRLGEAAIALRDWLIAEAKGGFR